MTPTRQLYAMKENPVSEDDVMFMIGYEHAKRLNEVSECAIYWCVNEFDGLRRIKHLAKINSWYIEFDGGDKDAQWEKIISSPLIPSLIVESYSGYQVYWNAVDAKPENYREIEERLIHHFGSDPKPKDLTRVLRAPGYYHLKNKANPFLVSVKFESEFKYRERIMMHFFKEVPEEDEVTPEVNLKATKAYTSPSDTSLTDWLDALDNEWALQMLSGKACVNYETYTFKPVARRRLNIIVNGKSSSCFIDEKKRIGANPGGPTVWQWLSYFGNTNLEIMKILKEYLGYGKNA